MNSVILPSLEMLFDGVMRKFFIFTIVLILGISVSAQSISDCTPAVPIPPSSRAFDAGEKLSYVIQYRCLGIRSDVGNARMELSPTPYFEGRPTFQSVASGETVKFFDSFFKVRDVYKSRFFSDNGRPIWFHRDIEEGGYKVTNDMHWNTATDEIDAKARYISSKRSKDTLLAGRPCTYDLISLFYAARNMDYSEVIPGKNYPLSFVIDEEIYDIYFRFEGREVKRIPKMGTFRTMKFALMVIEGEVFNGDYEIFLWISDDKNKIPLWIESPIRVGTVMGRLTGYENLKHPLSSKIK